MAKISVPDLTNITDPGDFSRYCSVAINDLAGAVNGGIEFDSNVRSKTLTVTFSSAGTQQTIAHGLARVPTGYIQCGANAATSLYNTQNSDRVNIYLISSAAATVQIIVF